MVKFFASNSNFLYLPNLPKKKKERKKKQKVPKLPSPNNARARTEAKFAPIFPETSSTFLYILIYSPRNGYARELICV